MEGRGRKSAASLSVVSSNEIERIERPRPPSDLNQEQAAEWTSIVNRMPAEWFPRETHGMLAQLCRHLVSARRVADMIGALENELTKEAEDDDKSQAELILGATKAFDRLYKMQEREGRAISSLSTKMRLSQQSTYDKSKRKPGQTRKPWES
jgi:uncharacterized protein YicC (UPF0701 family)